MIFAIDPGPTRSAYVLYADGCLSGFGILDNAEMLDFIDVLDIGYKTAAVEMVEGRGMPVGKDVFETCLWIGRFMQKMQSEPLLVYRRVIKLHHCGIVTARDSNIRQAVIDRFPAIGGGKCPQVGVKADPGPLYGVSKDVWQALALALYVEDQANSNLSS